ncbi:sodium/solute symporter [candidate division KSB1 bacterium]|nr:sodium/solute symporter [candidate division KSB1 bacterium]
MALIDIIIVISFLLFSFLIGSLFYRWVGGSDDYYVAGRQLTPFLLAATLTATNVNMYSFIGQTGIAYKWGISIVWLAWTGNMSLVIAGLLVVPIYRRLRIRSVPEFLGMRYNKGFQAFVGILWMLRLCFWLAVILYASIIAAIAMTGIESYWFWVFAMAGVAIIYTMMGGMWSVTLADAFQFVFMLGGALVLLPVAMSEVGWMEGLQAKFAANPAFKYHLNFVPPQGDFDWKAILGFFLISLKWAGIDQGMVQRTLGAKSVKTAAKGLTLSGIITTPFALLWILPGLAAGLIYAPDYLQKLYPNVDNSFEMAIPQLLVDTIPQLLPGLLGLIIAGMVASQLSTLSSDLNSAATLYTNDFYKNILKKDATSKNVLFMVRLMTGITGLFMILFAFLVPVLGGAVKAQLTMVSILDMPLFVVCVIYGFLWRRTNWQGAIGGYAAGVIAGIIAFHPWSAPFGVFATCTFISMIVSLIATPIITLFFKPPVETEEFRLAWNARYPSKEEKDANDIYYLIPKSPKGRVAGLIVITGILTFFVGVVMGSTGTLTASWVAIIGMCIFFAGSLLRVHSD